MVIQYSPRDLVRRSFFVALSLDWNMVEDYSEVKLYVESSLPSKRISGALCDKLFCVGLQVEVNVVGRMQRRDEES